MNEAQLELAIMELFQDEGYEYVCGNTIMRETADVLLKDDLRLYLKNKYRADEITDNEIEAFSSWSAVLMSRFMKQTRLFSRIWWRGSFSGARIKRNRICLCALSTLTTSTTTSSRL